MLVEEEEQVRQVTGGEKTLEGGTSQPGVGTI